MTINQIGILSLEPSLWRRGPRICPQLFYREEKISLRLLGPSYRLTLSPIVAIGQRWGSRSNRRSQLTSSQSPEMVD